MYILTFDTSSKTDSCSILKESGELLVNLTCLSPRSQSEKIVPLIELAITNAGIKKEEIAYIGVCKGPGSFTGTRIGIATAIGLSRAWGIEAYGVDKFEITEFSTGKKAYLSKGGKTYCKDGDQLVESEVQKEWVMIDEQSLTNSEIMARILVKDSKKNSRNLLALY